MTGCAARGAPVTGPQTLRCTPPLEPQLRTDLYVGGGISDSAWKRFTDEVLVKHFRPGGTVISTNGWWTGPRGITSHGRGYVIVVLAPAKDTLVQRNGVRSMIAEVKERFRHLSVGWEEDWVCLTW